MKQDIQKIEIWMASILGLEDIISYNQWSHTSNLEDYQ